MRDRRWIARNTRWNRLAATAALVPFVTGSCGSPVAADPGALPAQTFDVCGNPATDLRLNGQGFVFAGIVVPGGTIPEGGVPGSACQTLEDQRIGTLFAQGTFVVGMPSAAPDDLTYEDFFLRLDGQGAIATSGPVKNGVPYEHVILGGTGSFQGLDGEAHVEALDGTGLQFRIAFPGP